MNLYSQTIITINWRIIWINWRKRLLSFQTSTHIDFPLLALCMSAHTRVLDMVSKRKNRLETNTYMWGRWSLGRSKGWFVLIKICLVRLRSPSLSGSLAEAIRRKLSPFKFLSGKVAGYLQESERETDNLVSPSSPLLLKTSAILQRSNKSVQFNLHLCLATVA